MYRDSSYLILASLGTMVSQYAFHSLIGRQLGPEEYGLLSAYLAIWIFVHNVSWAFQTAVAIEVKKFLLRHESREGPFLAALAASFLAITATAFVLYLPLGVWLQGFLRHQDLPVMVAFGLFCALWLLVPATLGVLQGAERFGLMAIGVVMPFFLRLGLSAIALALGLGLRGVVFAMLLEVVCSILLMRFLVHRASLHLTPTTPEVWVLVRRTLRYAALLCLTGFAVSALMNSDVLLARHFFTEREAGLFAAAAVLGKVPVYVVLSVASVVVPKLVALKEKGGDWFALALRAVGANGILLALGWAFIHVVAPLLVLLLYGRDFEQAVPFLRLYCWMAFFNGILQVLVQVLMALKAVSAQPILAGSILIALAVAVYVVRDPRSLIMSYASINALLVVLASGLLWRFRQRHLTA